MAEIAAQHDAIGEWFPGTPDGGYSSWDLRSMVPQSLSRDQSFHLLPSSYRTMACVRLHSVTHGPGMILYFREQE